MVWETARSTRFLKLYLFPHLLHGDMEAALMHLILDVTSSGLPHIAQHLSEYVFERVVAYLPAMLSRGLHGAITVVAHVEGGAIEVTAVLGGVTIMSAQ